jgi:hypothetical protein
MNHALGTSSFSVSSQALWQHGPSQLTLVIGLYSLIRGRAEPVWMGLAGFSLAFAVLCRPTDLLLALPLGAYVIIYHRPEASPQFHTKLHSCKHPCGSAGETRTAGEHVCRKDAANKTGRSAERNSQGSWTRSSAARSMRNAWPR